MHVILILHACNTDTKSVCLKIKNPKPKKSKTKEVLSTLINLCNSFVPGMVSEASKHSLN